MKKTGAVRRIIVVIVAMLLLLAAISAIILISGARDRVPGVWERETSYLEDYGCGTTLYTTLYPDGKVYSVLLDADSRELLEKSRGTWDMYGLTITVHSGGEDSAAEYSLNPLTGTMKDGELKYHRIEITGEELEKLEALFR